MPIKSQEIRSQELKSLRKKVLCLGKQSVHNLRTFDLGDHNGVPQDPITLHLETILSIFFNLKFSSGLLKFFFFGKFIFVS